MIRKDGHAQKALDLVGRMLRDAIQHPGLYPDRLTVIILEENMIRKVLTPERLKLLRTLRRQKVESIQELARILKRPVASVSRDLKLLETYGFIRLDRNGRTKRPQLTKELIAIPL